MTSSWLAEYSAALDVRDTREKAQSSYIDAYTKLADRTAALEAAASSAGVAASTTTTTTTTTSSAPPTSPTPAKASRPSTPAKGKSKAQDDDAAPPSDTLSRLRLDLATTQSARAALAARLPPLTAELASLKAQAARDARRIEELGRERAALERKVRDRDEEIREKGRLVEKVQDEMVGLEMQVNVAEQRAEELRRENDGLVERWMRRVGREAERLNEEGGWR